MARASRGRLLIAIGSIAVGLIWMGQGLGLLRGSSFMVDDTRFALIGAGLIVVGVALAISVWRGRRQP